ncbi:hypothetical protein TNCV_1004481 [Trichonephila clavipes]|nr:hypothetical protein TNCV_1004481 [Trichonephila clavipes]
MLAILPFHLHPLPIWSSFPVQSAKTEPTWSVPPQHYQYQSKPPSGSLTLGCTRKEQTCRLLNGHIRSLIYTDGGGVPGLLEQTLREGMGDHKDSDLHSNLWSETSSFSTRWRCSQEHCKKQTCITTVDKAVIAGKEV